MHPPKHVRADHLGNRLAKHPACGGIGVQDGAAFINQRDRVRAVFDKGGGELRGFLGFAGQNYLPVTRTISLTVVTPVKTFSIAASRSVRMPAARPASNSFALSACSTTSRRMASVTGRISKIPSRPV